MAGSNEFYKNPDYRLFNRFCFIAGFLLFFAEVAVARADSTASWPVVVVLAWLTSPGLLLVLANGEGSTMSQILNPMKASWAFLFGDTLCLPLALGAAAAGWRVSRNDLPIVNAWWLTFAAIAGGVIVSFTFHNVLDVPNYRKQGELLRVVSRSKLWHDRATFFSLTAALIYLGLPVLSSGTLWAHASLLPILVVISLGAFFLLAFVGDGMIHRLDPVNLHPKMKSDWTGIAKQVGVR